MMDSSPEEEDFPGRLLHQAALWDNLELLEDLVAGGGQEKELINSQDSWGRTPLHAAAICDQSKCIRFLCQVGADANIQCGTRGENKTPLHLSAEYGHLSNVKVLLEFGACMLQKDSNGMTPSDLADKARHLECMEILKTAAGAREKHRFDRHAALRDACTCGNLTSIKQLLQQNDAAAATEEIVNMAPNGANTLLFTACQSGNAEIVSVLLDYGADGRFHPVTKYSPLYIASYHGHSSIVSLLIEKFPELIQLHTVEKWLPIHAAVLNGHAHVLEQLLNVHNYPLHLLKRFKDLNAEFEYLMPYDVNERDATGQNVLYIASFLGNKKLLDLLLQFRVKATRIQKNDDSVCMQPPASSPASSKRRISIGIQSILSKLRIDSPNLDENVDDYINPLRIDMYCNNNTETALHAAVKRGHYDIALSLLQNGANPNLMILHYVDYNNESMSCCSAEDDFTNSCQSNSLMEACANRDVALVDLLLQYGARDDECKALAIVVQNKDEILTAKLLSTKAYPDREYKINKKAMTENIQSTQFSLFSNVINLTYSTIFPNTPTMINWHNQRCHLSQIRTEWLIDAALQLNNKLKLNPRGTQIALYAITRLDISNNSLTTLPLAVFQLCSLKLFNCSQNKIDKLPLPLETTTGNDKTKQTRKQGGKLLNYNCPVLEELYLQDNRLDHIPDAIFRLPSLVTLVVSNNKLQQLSYAMWMAPKLKELNASFNLLKELPTNDIAKESGDCGDRMSISSSDSQLSIHAEHVDLEASCYDDDAAATATEEEEDGEGKLPVRYRKKERSYMQLELEQKHHLWHRSVEVTEQILHRHSDEQTAEKASQLSALNLAHNLFTGVPPVLPCLAVNLTRLNLAFNSLRSMSHITSYPSALKQLDLSHNQISVWPSLPQVEAQDVMELANLACYSNCKEKHPISAARRQSGRSVRNIVLHTVCSHRRHLRLDNLRTLILTDNQLNRIQLTTDDDGDFSTIEEDDLDKTMILSGKQRLMFPNLSMLDISNNNLREIPVNIYELNNLSVLNISGNIDINELPPQMGLLSRLWNLNTRGCALQEPLKSMIDSKKYKTMDIIGYLKSVLEDAKPYARMKLMIVGVQGIGKTSLLEQLRQEGLTKRKPEHWAKRMGNKNINVKTSRGANMSTVGVDIGDWIYEKKVRNQSSHGPVVFRTWDFGGQKEYYATHQYFLSKRSLYLVVWKISDGYRGLNEILQWLVNIQARAPNSPVLIIGTHYDTLQTNQRSEEYQQIIRERFINIVDAEKCGLPRVLDTIEVSCRTRHNIKLLCNLIYDTVFSLRPPGSKELLLEQKVPASYLALEDVVVGVATERRISGADPVLNADEYRAVVASEMQMKYGKTFRDLGELHQATLFLHDNGVLLHYDDATLKDLYFLDPQWLCDMLAHVVTIREINPFARSGVMKLEDLQHIFKASNLGGCETRGYIVNLLNKFEVALTWDSRTLLIPSLLPSEEDIYMAQLYPGQFHPMVKVRVPLRSRGWALRGKKTALFSTRDQSAPGRFDMSLPSTNRTIDDATYNVQKRYDVTYRQSGSSRAVIRRLLLMSYFPSGFWSRLMSRILADDTIIDTIRSFFIFPKEVAQDVELVKLLDFKAEWVLWQSGLQLKYGDVTLFRLREVLHNSATFYRQLKFKLKQEGVWCDVDLQNSSILEIYFPIESIVIKPNLSEDGDLRTFKIKTEIVIEPQMESTAQLLALAVDHIDILLEDWYPTLGTRFVHTSEGKFLITRLIPCPECLCASPPEVQQQFMQFPGEPPKYSSEEDSTTADSFNTKLVRQSQESYTSECDSGVGHDYSPTSTLEGHPNLLPAAAQADECGVYYSWMVEECILAAYSSRAVNCPLHQDVRLKQIAPDTIFMDLGDRYLIRPENIKKGRLLGRGAFGFVFKGTCKMRGMNQMIDVAMKMLQPVQPGPNARPSAVIAFKAAQGKWDRDPLQYACKAYCTARQELNILLSLKHPNIVPFVGVCTSPLALVLDLAPQGALDLVLRHYRRTGAKVGVYTLQAIILQVAKAIEYLHRQHIIYRDLKSENVLVWEMPPPFVDHPANTVHIKVADYGISRLTLPSGTKGFGGTEGFMAPEIMRYNGEEEYTEKVDCFSFGMFIYELLTLHQPFEGHESVKECILEGGRPPLTYRETLYPSYFLDLMVLCWSQQPKDRPSASQIVSIASAPEFTHLCDVMSLKHQAQVVAATSAPITQITDDGLSGSEMWLMCKNSRVDLLLAADRGWLQYHTMSLPIKPTAACTVASAIWIGDYIGKIHAYSVTDGFKLFTYSLEENEGNVSIKDLLYLPAMKRVACALTNGRLFLLNSEIIPKTQSAAEGSFVMTELGASTHINCLCALYKTGGEGGQKGRKRGQEGEVVCELWSGQSQGQISIYTIKEQVVASHDLLNHYTPPIIEGVVEVMQMISSVGSTSVWSYVQPGCIVYQWDQMSRQIINKLDTSKLVPCSESLKSIAIDEHLSPTNCQITALAVLNEELYIGTTWGCVIIADGATLRPVTIFRPYEEEIQAIVPLARPSSLTDDTPLVATIGRGYRSLPSRYIDVAPHHASLLLHSPNNMMTSSHSLSALCSNNQPFVLLWRAEHWSTL